MELIERVTSSRTIYDGKLVHLRVDTVQLPNGVESQREIVTHRGAVCIVALVTEDTVLMVRQFRLAAGRVLLEIPAGTMEAGENPDACAARELEEETGFKPGALRELFRAFLSPGYSTERIHAYLATGLTDGTVHLDAGENVRVVKVPIADIDRMISAGEIEDAKSVAALMTALRLLNLPSG